MAIGEVFLSAFITVLFEKLASGELRKLFRREDVDAQMRESEDLLSQIKAVLLDAEEKQLTDEAVQRWLDDLQDLAYDLDDVLDEFATEALRRKLMGEPTHASTSKVWNFIPTCCTNLKPRAVIFDVEMRSKIKEITDRLNSISAKISKLNLVKDVGTRPGKAWKRPETTSLVLEPRIYGREQEKRRIIELLLSQASNKLGVIPIVGMGGIGKTTLAQMVYDDEIVKNHFGLKAWVCVSEEFDIMRITKDVLGLVTSQSCTSFNSLEQVQVQLKQALAGKKFLIVLDDVWNEKYDDWIALKAPFNDGAQGSKVIVTTRNGEVAKKMGAVKLHDIQVLSDDDCWSLFAHHAFENTSIDANPNLESIGRKIVEKCKGLPLAARTLGGLLKCKERVEEWKAVLDSKIWDLSDNDSGILPALRLSYHNLPAHLKRCFAYCAIIPKDYEFEEQEIVLLWMAEGLIQQKNMRQMEDIGGEYFRELLSRSFFQPSNTSKSSTFVMHDLINDLAQSVARDICFRLEDKLKDPMQCKNLKKARHSSCIQGYFDEKKEFETLYETKNLRTFLPFCFQTYRRYSDVPIDLFLEMRFSRVLSLSRYSINVLPHSIRDLKHLRYLDFSYTKIESLPDSLGTVYNLQTLLLRKCENLKKLPPDMGNLINLRHLDTTNSNSLEEMPTGIPKLTCLQTLSNFIVTKDNGIRIRELGNLTHLRGTICISGLENVLDPLDARAACLHEKLRLDVLLMEWRQSSDDPRNEGVETTEVLNMLRPHEELEKLHIKGYLGKIFPSWIGDLPCLKNLSIEGCPQLLSSLPKLLEMSNTSEILPQLQRLQISKCPQLRCLFEEENEGQQQYCLATLQHLSIYDCEKLEKLPRELHSFTSLTDLKICGTSLVAFPEAGFPSTLRTLDVSGCPSLTYLISCRAGGLPLTLKDLYIGNCEKLEALIVEEGMNINCPFLESLLIKCCPSLKRLPDALPNNNSLNTLIITKCEKLESVPEGWLTHNSLQHLTIDGLSAGGGILSYFVEKGTNFVTNLTSLHIHVEKKMRSKPPPSEWGLHRLSSLKHLAFLGEETSMVKEAEEEENSSSWCSFSVDGMLLPNSLTQLWIFAFPNLEKLSFKDFQNLTSLDELWISDCPRLASFPEQGLPPSLEILIIIETPILACLCEKEKGEHWPLISHIPAVSI